MKKKLQDNDELLIMKEIICFENERSQVMGGKETIIVLDTLTQTGTMTGTLL
ncbi:hypothetical protein [Pedobacter sp. L105]|uniref:hypothetical protein n=1 Tax=Pedobacter sp. L105 TaxID=1641871 RepID=UPI00131C58CD|nr:hypothetical protein [Pedobacter sp. L105]